MRNSTKQLISIFWRHSATQKRPSSFRNVTKNIIEMLDLEVSSHHPYSPDLVLADFYLFQSLFNCLHCVSVNNDVKIRILLDDFFVSRPNNCYLRSFDKIVRSNKYKKIITLLVNLLLLLFC